MKRPTPVWNRANVLRVNEKGIRAAIIADYIRASNYRGAVIFTCGHAGQTLRDALQGAGLSGALLSYEPTLVEVGPKGPISANRWWSPEDIHISWPDLFDATPGHLPVALMVRIAQALASTRRSRDTVEKITNGGPWFVPTGSGETIVCLKMAFPNVQFAAVYDNARQETTRDPESPLNSIVDAFFPVEHWNGKL
jgi:hypothetical protein